MWRRWCAVVALGALQACGSTGGGSEAPEDLGAIYNDNREDLLETHDRLVALSTTSEANLPTSGSATFEGQAGIYLDTALDLSLVGDATVTADFGQGTISGQATNFIGTEGGFTADEYDGTLNLSGGRIGTGGPSDASGILSGTLTGGGHVVTIDAQMQGGFVGNPDVAGLVLDSTGGTATVDGFLTPGGVGIVAER
jgi:hypothetical protein